MKKKLPGSGFNIATFGLHLLRVYVLLSSIVRASDFYSEGRKAANSLTSFQYAGATTNRKTSALEAVKLLAKGKDNSVQSLQGTGQE